MEPENGREIVILPRKVCSSREKQMRGQDNQIESIALFTYIRTSRA